MRYCLVMRFRAFLFFSLLFVPLLASAQDLPVEEEYVKAKVLSIEDVQLENNRLRQNADLKILSGENECETVSIENTIKGSRESLRLNQGDRVILQRFTQIDGESGYILHEKYRLNSLWILAILFLVLGVIIGGKRGASAIAGLAASIAVVIFFIVPSIVSGVSPLLISMVGCVLIACISIYLAHGFNRRASVALISTIITLVFAVGITIVAVSFAKLFGMGAEEALFLQFGPLEQVNLRGLLLGGILIGSLGVLDDVTAAQAAAIDELSKANPNLSFRDLYSSGTSIGREHIASMINTLALAYAGASLPLLMLFWIDQEAPLWVILNSEFLAEEIVRTLIGSSALLLAVPISTWIAAGVFGRK